jgi:hypothetical protein
MKKLITFLLIVLLSGVAAKSANTYLIYRSATGGKWTNTTGIKNPVLVDLLKANGGSEASFNAWYTDRCLVSPAMGGGSQFAAGDQVWIIGGTYNLNDSIVICPGVGIYGGFSGSESALTGRAKGTNAWDFTNETVLMGDTTKVCIAGGSESAAAVLDGMTLSNFKNKVSAFSGSAASLNGSQTVMQNCIIKNCVTLSNSATSSGAVVLIGGASLKNCYIHDNTTAGYGGGVSVCGDGCTLDGCKIVNNTATLFGGGVSLYATTSGVKVTNCDISNNISSTKSGAGLLVFSTSATNADPITIKDCSFTSNSAPAGSAGALYLNTNTFNVVNVSGCTFTANSSQPTKATTNGGGAIWISKGIHNIDKCKFKDNSSKYYGGAILIAGQVAATVTVSNSVFTGNTCSLHGGVFMIMDSVTVNNCLIYGNKAGNFAYVSANTGVFSTFNNCTFASNLNVAGTAAAGFYLSTPKATNAKFANCLFYKCGAKPVAVDPATTGTDAILPDLTYCGFDQDLSSTWSGAGNVFTVDSTSYMDPVNNDYHLTKTSPAIDAGMPISDYAVDLDGLTRDANFDMGAYEYNPKYTSLEKVEESVKCYTNGNNLMIKGLESGKVVNVYSITGVRLLSRKITDETISISLPRGIYIVNAESYKGKVVIR